MFIRPHTLILDASQVTPTVACFSFPVSRKFYDEFGRELSNFQVFLNFDETACVF